MMIDHMNNFIDFQLFWEGHAQHLQVVCRNGSHRSHPV